MIIIFCGFPGVGKSAIAKKLIKKLNDFGTTELISSDKIDHKVYERIFTLVRENLGKVDYIVVDATFYKKKRRAKIHKLAGKEKVFTVYVNCSLGTALKRNKERKPHISEKAVHIIYHQFQKPTKPNIIIDTDKISPEEAATKVMKKIKP